MLEITVTYLEIPLSFVEKGMNRMVKGTCVSEAFTDPRLPDYPVTIQDYWGKRSSACTLTFAILHNSQPISNDRDLGYFLPMQHL